MGDDLVMTHDPPSDTHIVVLGMLLTRRRHPVEESIPPAFGSWQRVVGRTALPRRYGLAPPSSPPYSDGTHVRHVSRVVI